VVGGEAEDTEKEQTNNKGNESFHVSFMGEKWKNASLHGLWYFITNLRQKKAAILQNRQKVDKWFTTCH
jgi:hypothetical protein